MNKLNIDKTFGVYSIKCTIDSKLYIGSTSKTFSYRWRQWKYHLRKGSASNKHLQNAWNKYGEDAFEFSVLEVIEDKEIVLEREQYYIDLRNVTDTDIGYNVNKNASSHRLGSKQSEETKEKLRGKTPWNKGKKNEYSLGPHSEEAKEKMREKALGKKHTETTRKLISEKGLGRPSPNKGKQILPHVYEALQEGRKKVKGENHPMHGKSHTAESKKKMSESHKLKDTTGKENPFYGKTHSEEVKQKLREINKNNEPNAQSYRFTSPEGIVFEGNNINRFCREYNLIPSSMCLVKQGKQKIHKGWTL